MCGIFGSPNISPMVRRLLPYLGLEMEQRGRDAWGASNGSQIIRHVGAISDTWHEEIAEFAGWTKGIFHTRGASTGSPRELENAHPFSYQKADGSWVIGIHNGIISNHSTLNSKYGRNCSVDSMHIWMHRAEGKPWDDLQGWGNLAWWENDSNGAQQLNLARFNNDALNVAELEGGEYVFCSSMLPVRTMAKMLGNPVRRWFNIEERYHYYFAPNREGRLVLHKSEQKLPFLETSNYSSYRGGGSSYSLSGDGYCAKCGHAKVDTKQAMLCQNCLQGLITQFVQWDTRHVTGAVS